MKRMNDELSKIQKDLDFADAEIIKQAQRAKKLKMQQQTREKNEASFLTAIQALEAEPGDHSSALPAPPIAATTTLPHTGGLSLSAPPTRARAPPASAAAPARVASPAPARTASPALPPASAAPPILAAPAQAQAAPAPPPPPPPRT